jgi:hypothetical protein
MGYLHRIVESDRLWEPQPLEGPLAANHPTILSREEARALGLKRFFTGEPCSKQGHIAERFVCNGICLKCSSEQSAKNRAANLEKVRERDREHARKYRARNPERFKENVRKWQAANWQWILEYQRTRRAASRQAGFEQGQAQQAASRPAARGQAQQAASPAARGDRQRGRHDRRMVMEST